MEVEYTCQVCKVTRRKVTCPDRPDPKVNVTEYVQMLTNRCGLDHLTISPYCGADRVDLWIPIQDQDPHWWLGKPKK